MTKREFFETITASTLAEEIKEFAQNEINKLDEEKAKNAQKRAERAKENEPLYAAILEIMTDEPAIASEIATKIGVSTSKASSLLRSLVAEGKVSLTPEKIKSGKSKVNGYVLSEVTEDTEDTEVTE